MIIHIHCFGLLNINYVNCSRTKICHVIANITQVSLKTTTNNNNKISS